MQYSIDQPLPALFGPDSHDPEVDRIPLSNDRVVSSSPVSRDNLLDKCPDNHFLPVIDSRIRGTDPSVPSRNFYTGEILPTRASFSRNCPCNVHPNNLIRRDIKDTDTLRVTAGTSQAPTGENVQ